MTTDIESPLLAQVGLCQLHDVSWINLFLFCHLSIRIDNEFHLSRLDPQHVLHDRICAIVCHDKIGEYRTFLTFSIQPADALRDRARTPVELSDHTARTGFL